MPRFVPSTLRQIKKSAARGQRLTGYPRIVSIVRWQPGWVAEERLTNRSTRGHPRDPPPSRYSSLASASLR